MTRTEAPGLECIGMVSGVLWTDVNNDQWMDLLVVGEWIPPTLFIDEAGSLHEATTAAGAGSLVLA